jgi:ketosteroid isomerase-like protein
MLGSSANNPGKRTLTVETTRFVANDVVLADARYEIEGSGGASARKMWSTFLMKREAGGWRIAAIRRSDDLRFS